MKKILLGLIFISSFLGSYAQSVGIGTTSPASSAQLDISAANKGLLPPRVALTSVNDLTTIASPATGLLVYNTATAGVSPTNVIPGYYYYTGTNWLRITNPGNASGDMQYWNGTQWVIIPAGVTGSTLSICNGVPQWGACPTGALPTVVTSSITSITGTTANSGGNVTADGGNTVTARGVCYATTINPTISDLVVPAAAGGTGTFTSALTGLTPSTLYHLRAYATNGIGTAYGSDSTFTTGAITLPAINTNGIFGIGSNSAFGGGTVTSSGNASILERGICYATTVDPTTSSSKVVDGSTITGTFTGGMTGLTSSTLYHVRAYVTNTVGTAYGHDTTFSTLAAGGFAATYTFDSVKTTSGTTDPTPLQSIPNITLTPFTAVATSGSLSANSNSGFRFSFIGWSLGATNGSNVFTSGADSTQKYYEVTIAPAAGHTMTLNSLTFRLQRSGTGTRHAFVRSSKDAFAANLPASVVPADATLSVVATNKFETTDASINVPGCTITLGGAGFTNISSAVTFRFYGTDAEGSGGTFSIDDVVFNGTAL